MKFWRTTTGRPRRVRGTLAVAMALLGSLGTTTASAATAPSATSSAFSTCTLKAFTYNGAYICDTNVLLVNDNSPIFPPVANNGGEEIFVIGTNWQIWHAWPGSNGWHSLGGVAKHSTANGVFFWNANPFTIETDGTDNNEWCDDWGSPTWSGWYSCFG